MLSLLCCTGVVGLVLGIIGVVRTKGGQRKGRWAAVSAIVIGAIATIAGIAAIAGLIWVGATTVPEDEAHVGQCVDTSSFASTNDLWRADCDEEHDAEIIVAEELDGTDVELYTTSSDEDFCASFDLRPEHRAALDNGDYDVEIATDAVSDDVQAGDDVVCYLQRSDGSKLDGPLGD